MKSALSGYEDRSSDVADKLERMGFYKTADTVELFMFDVGNYRDFLTEHWKRIRTTNMVERVNTEIKRRTKVEAAFPSRESFMRLIGSILIDLCEDWVTGSPVFIPGLPVLRGTREQQEQRSPIFPSGNYPERTMVRSLLSRSPQAFHQWF